jgi:hypothetical protein
MRDDWEESDIRSLHKWAVYSVSKLVTNISEQFECFNNILVLHVHKTRVTSAKACDVPRSTVQKVCNEISTSSTDHQGFASARKAYGGKYATGMTSEQSYGLL